MCRNAFVRAGNESPAQPLAAELTRKGWQTSSYRRKLQRSQIGQRSGSGQSEVTRAVARRITYNLRYASQDSMFVYRYVCGNWSGGL